MSDDEISEQIGKLRTMAASKHTLSAEMAQTALNIIEPLQADRDRLKNEVPRHLKHEHTCGSCGALRDCYWLGCYYNALADCDPGYGCRTPKVAK